MPTWRCPHCGTPQAETARCWVCRRSSTACGTCRHFRRSVAVQLGYCGLDRGRAPLIGDEIRACWEAGPSALPDPAGPPVTPDRYPSMAGADRLEFVDVDRLSGTGREAATSAAAGTPSAAAGTPTTPTPSPAEPGWSLWGDLER